MNISAIALAWIASLPTLATAEIFTVQGLGMKSCREVVTDYANDPLSKALVFEWSAGFLTGMDMFRSHTLGSPKDMEGLILEGETAGSNGIVDPIIRICRTHPEDSLLNAVAKFYGQLPESEKPPAASN